MPAYFSGGSIQTPATRYMFIDGGYLQRLFSKMSERYFGGAPLDVEYHKLANGAKKVFYYDCLPGRKERESEEDFQRRVREREEHFEMLRGITGWHVQLGTVKGEGGKLRQKQVDTLLSVDMLAHSYRRNAAEIALVAGDLDFKPAVDALVQDGMYVILYFDQGHVSKELMASADDRRHLNIHAARGWLSDSFLSKYEIPVPSSSPADEVRGHKLLRQGTLADGKDAWLYQGPDGFFSLVFDLRDIRGSKMYVRGKSVDVVGKFTEDVFEKVSWREA